MDLLDAKGAAMPLLCSNLAKKNDEKRSKTMKKSEKQKNWDRQIIKFVVPFTSGKSKEILARKVRKRGFSVPLFVQYNLCL